MAKVLKKVVLSCLSILGISFIVWTVFLINPSLSYANQTQFNNVTIYHNQALEEGTLSVIKNAVSLIETSDIYDQEINIQLCLNDDNIYPNLYPFAGATAYAFLNKTVIYASIPNFEKNVSSFTWEINNNQERKYNLTTLLAHEFMHNVQYNHNPRYNITSTLGKINWKFEGHAEYIAREFKNDGLLEIKIALYQIEENKNHIGVPVFDLEDGTIQNLAYFKYSLVIQYMMEVKSMNFDQVCTSKANVDTLYSEMIEWNKSATTK